MGVKGGGGGGRGVILLLTRPLEVGSEKRGEYSVVLSFARGARVRQIETDRNTGAPSWLCFTPSFASFLRRYCFYACYW